MEEDLSAKIDALRARRRQILQAMRDRREVGFSYQDLYQQLFEINVEILHERQKQSG
jgi:hypothetical protein